MIKSNDQEKRQLCDYLSFDDTNTTKNEYESELNEPPNSMKILANSMPQRSHDDQNNDLKLRYSTNSNLL